MNKQTASIKKIFTDLMQDHCCKYACKCEKTHLYCENELDHGIELQAVIDIVERAEILENEYEKACKEFLKGCSFADDGKPEECEECTKAFLNHIKMLAEKEKPTLTNKQYYETILRSEHWL